MPSIRIVGAGRAGRSLALALAARGWDVAEVLRRADVASGAIARAAVGVDLCMIATPDAVVAEVAGAIRPQPDSVVGHVSGSLPLDVLAPHARRTSVHPLVSLPDPDRGAAALLAGAWFAVAGDPVGADMVAALGGRLVEVDGGHRAAYHAAACIASNHLVALMAQVERVAALAGVPLAAYLDLVRATVDNVAAAGPAAALTGPVARGDWMTVDAHLRAIGPAEAALYLPLARAAADLSGRAFPEARRRDHEETACP